MAGTGAALDGLGGPRQRLGMAGAALAGGSGWRGRRSPAAWDGWGGVEHAGGLRKVHGGASHGKKMASGRCFLFLSSEGEEIQKRKASRAKYKVCWIQVLMRFFFF